MTFRLPEGVLSDVRLARSLDLATSVVITALCSFRVYRVLGTPALTGIDDENITQVYGLNIARGFGYVYTPRFEHVEGATSPLWVAVHSALFKLTATPEPYVLFCSAALSALAIYCSLGIARQVVAALSLPRWTSWIPLFAIVAQPHYFHWTVVAMMDQGVWAALVLGLMSVLLRHVRSDEGSERASLLGVLLCILGVLARPEAILLMPAMVLMAGVIVVLNRGAAAASRIALPYLAAIALALFGLTSVRLSYFGHPLPNTYYAKVSSNPVDNIVQGLRYVVGFLGSNIVVLPSLLATGLGLMLGAQSLLANRKARTPVPFAHSAMLLIGGTTSIVVVAIILEGGDHFPGFRMLQPYVPLLSVALLFYVPLSAGWTRLAVNRITGLVWSVATVAGTLIASYAAFSVAKKDFIEDFTLAAEGRRLGELFNGLLDRPSIGVLPAGGIAVTYQGRVVDLLGLNWTEMAHASGRRTGIPGHSAFDLRVFWSQPPAIMLPTILADASFLQEKRTPGDYELWVLPGLMNAPRFRQAYAPVYMHLAECLVFAYARTDFIARHRGDSRIESLGWERFRPVTPLAFASQQSQAPLDH